MQGSQVKLIVGLGNPGRQYSFTRHNMGFLVVDQLAAEHVISVTVKGFNALYGRGRIEDVPVLLAKPQTFMNLSGPAVFKLFDYFKMTDLSDVIVIHDDLDLPFGAVRVKTDGGHGGHKGLLSIIETLGGPEFLRVRIGIGKPVIKTLTEDHVLGRFPEGEIRQLPKVVAMAGDAVGVTLTEGMQTAMNRYNGMTIDNYFNEEV